MNGKKNTSGLEGFVKITGATVNKSTTVIYAADGGGVFSEASTTPVKVNDFYIAEAETEYSKWYEVYVWATDASARKDSVYTFANKGRAGRDGTDGAEPVEGNSEPVCYVSWRDAVVWCNAASEKAGLVPVYYVEGTVNFNSGNVLRVSETSSEAAYGSGKAEKAVVNSKANGFRLPTEIEWEYAARGGNPDSEKWDWTYSGTNNESELKDYAVYSYGSSDTANVKTKKPNSAGIYDMSGNVWEWCYDKISEGYYRVIRGGCWYANARGCTVEYCYSYSPVQTDWFTGFRVVCTKTN